MPVTPTVGQTITYKQYDQILKGTAIVVAGGFVIATSRDSDGAHLDSHARVVPVGNVLTAT